MKLYLLTREDKIDYDEFNSFVISAENDEESLQLAQNRQSGIYTILLIGTSNSPISKIVHESFCSG